MPAELTPRLGLRVWEDGPDQYSHLDLQYNWELIDAKLLDRTTDTATGPVTFQSATASQPGIRSRVTGDANDRITIQPDGIYLGSGSAATDVKLYRSAANVLKLDDAFEATKLSTPALAAATTAAISTSVTGDGHNRFNITAAGKHEWGPGSVAADTTLERTGTNQLTLSGALAASSVSASTITASSTLTINGLAISNSSGALATNAAYQSTSIITARAAAAGQVRLGDPSDSTNSSIYFGSAADTRLYRASAGILRSPGGLTLDGSLVVGAGATITGAGSFSGALSANSLAVTVSGTFGGNIAATGTGAFNGHNPISTYVVASNFRTGSSGRVVVPSSSNNNLWSIDNTAGTLRFFREDYNASGSGANGAVRITIADVGTTTITATAGNTPLILSPGSVVLNGDPSIIYLNGVSGSSRSVISYIGGTTNIDVAAGLAVRKIDGTSLGTWSTTGAGTLSIAGAFSVTGTSTFTGAATFNSTVSVTGGLTGLSFGSFSGYLDVGGAITGYSTITAGGAIVGYNTITAAGDFISTTGSLLLPIDASVYIGTNKLRLHANSNGQQYIDHAGQLNFRNLNVAATFTLTTGGTGTFAGACVAQQFSSSSDERLKKDFASTTKVLDKIMQMPVMAWKWKSSEVDAEDDFHIGPTAQAFNRAFFPERKDETHINMTDAVGINFAAIKELAQRVKRLESKLGEK